MPNRARETIDDLLWEAELEAEMAELSKLTPEQIEELAKGSSLTDEEARQMLARAIAKVEAEQGQPASAQEPDPEEALEALLDVGWIRRIAEMSPVEIKALATPRILTDAEAEAILRRAKTRSASGGR